MIYLLLFQVELHQNIKTQPLLNWIKNFIVAAWPLTQYTIAEMLSGLSDNESRQVLAKGMLTCIYSFRKCIPWALNYYHTKHHHYKLDRILNSVRPNAIEIWDICTNSVRATSSEEMNLWRRSFCIGATIGGVFWSQFSCNALF